jgi:diketogulonate reductase-like aldo/keto reductase
MQQRELGSSGVMVPEVGFGTWQYRGGSAPLRRAIELGAGFIDTAENYGSEGIVGEAIRGRREQVFLATKVSGEHLRYDQVIQAAEASLKRLGVPVIDLYQVHWPNRRVPIIETMRAMETLVERGLVRFIGVSNFSRREVEEAQRALRQNRIVANQVEYSLTSRQVEPDIESFYVPNRIAVIAYSPLARGALLRPRNRRGLAALQTIATETGKTMAQVALNWCLSRPGVFVIPKTDRVERVEEDAGASGWSLTPAQVSALDAAFA